MNEHLTHHAFVRSEMQLGLIKEINPASGSNFLECKLPPCTLIVFTSQKYSQKLSPFCTCLSRQKYWEFQLRLVPDIGWCQLVSGQCQFRWCPWKAKFIHSKTKRNWSRFFGEHTWRSIFRFQIRKRALCTSSSKCCHLRNHSKALSKPRPRILLSRFCLSFEWYELWRCRCTCDILKAIFMTLINHSKRKPMVP